MTLERRFLSFRPAGVAAVLAAFALVAVFPAFAPAAQNPVSGPVPKDQFQTAAPYAILIDAGSGTVLFEKNADALVAPSSMAKLMTAEVVFNELKEGRLTPDTEFMTSENAWRRGGAPSHTSSMFLPIHSRTKVIDLIQGAVIQSGNDACITLAEGLAGSENAFAAKMNERARTLGLTKSYFANSTGLPDPAMKVTVRELSRLAKHIVSAYPEFYKFYGEREFTWNKIRQQNRNPLLALNIGADGMKTGFTQEGGYGMVGSVLQNDLRLIVVVNGLKSAAERATEAKRIVEWGFKGFDTKLLFAEGQTVGDARLFGGAQGRVPLIGNGTINLLVPKNSTEKINAKIVYNGPVRAPVKEGQPLGILRVTRGDAVVLETPLHAGESIGKGTVSQAAFDAASELVIGLFRAGADRL